MKRLKIAYLLPDVRVSGGVGVIFQHTNRLLKRGHDVIVVTQGPLSSTDWFPDQTVPVIKACELPNDLDILVATAWQTAFEVAKLKAKHKCYFVQSDETRFHKQGNDFFHITQLSYLMNFHYLTEARWIQKWLLDNFDKKAALVPNGLDSSIFFPVTPLKKRSAKFRILLEGAIALPYKGMREAFEVVRDLDVEVWCVSSNGKPEPSWKCHKFFEQVPMHKMREIYSSCDILLKLSRVEGFFGPPLEMMACGGVNVVGKVTGYDEYIIDGENALVVDPEDVRGIQAAIKKLITDSVLRENLKQNGLETAKRWNWESNIDKLESYFYEIANLTDDYSPMREQTNQSIVYFYDKILSTPSLELPFIAHKIKRYIKNDFLQKRLARIYTYLKK